ncbi:hypothetical protein ACHAW5_008937 [Stephanodiscus triporus]|uniref:Uncharacterized protein n=1 Tax=Stephanodiscus triporus TaxID=2934178 RepID=A0ABD3N1F8_9STRA
MKAGAAIQSSSYILFAIVVSLRRCLADAIAPSIIRLGSISSPSRWVMLCKCSSAAKLEKYPTCGYRIDTIMPSAIRYDHSLRAATRRGILLGILDLSFFSSSLVSAANLPRGTGADLSRTGSIETLLPVVAIERSLKGAKLQLTKSEEVTPETCTNLLRFLSNVIPREENAFKRIFDAYSTPVSYKQKFLDQNAFLVYYTKGFDGPGRPGIEEEDTNSIQTLQYGFRNDAWAAMDDLFVEVEFYRDKSKGNDVSLEGKAELIDLIDKVLTSVDSYLRLAPIADLDMARREFVSKRGG